MVPDQARVVDDIIYLVFAFALLLNETVLEMAKQQSEEASWLNNALMIGSAPLSPLCEA
jgi:hypothetical protein